MRHTRWLPAAAMLLALVVGAPVRAVPAPEPSGASPLAQVPADAPIVIQVHGFERTKSRLLAMVQNAVPDLAQMAAGKIEEGLREALDGRQLKALVPEGPIFLVATKLPDPNQPVPHAAIFVRVTDYREFLNGFLKEDERKSLKADPAGFESATIHNETVYMVDRKGYAVFTPLKETAVHLVKKQPGLDTKLSKDDAQRFLQSDVSAYVDMIAVNKEYGDQIKAFRQMFEGLLQQAAAVQGGGDKNSLDLYKLLLGAFFQLQEDSRAIMAALEFRPEGLAVQTQVLVGSATKSNELLKDAKQSAFKEIATLPVGQMMYFGMQLDSALARAMQPWVQGMISPDKQSKAVKEAMEQMNAAGPRRSVSSASLPLEGLQVGEYKDPVKAADAQLKLLQALAAGQPFQAGAFKGKLEVKANAQEYRGFKLSSVHMTWDFGALAQQPGGKEMADFMKAIIGDSMNSWSGSDGKVFVQVTAKDWPAARQLLAQYLDGKAPLGEQQAFQAARKHLPAQTSMLGLMHVPLFVQAVTEMMSPIMKASGLPINIPVLKADKAKPTYLGVAVTLQPERGSLEMWVPGTAVFEVRKMIEWVLKPSPGQ